MSNQIFWLASYPKSGNTLLRSILIALFFTDDGVFDLDQASKIGQFETTVHIKRNEKIFGSDFKKINKISVLYQYMDKLQSKKALGLPRALSTSSAPHVLKGSNPRLPPPL